MHGFLGVHLLQALQNGVNNEFSFLRFELVFIFDFIIELTAFKKLDYNVERVLGLENFVKFHAAFVIQGSHDLDFSYDAFFSFIFAVGCFFGKGFDCVAFPCF